jgi:hypothetical protein
MPCWNSNPAAVSRAGTTRRLLSRSPSQETSPSPAGRRVSTLTSCPALRKARRSAVPTCPVPPGITTFTRAPYFASPDTRLIEVAMITAPSGNDSHACRRAVRLMGLVWMSVSETWNVIPIVKDR